MAFVSHFGSRICFQLVSLMVLELHHNFQQHGDSKHKFRNLVIRVLP